MQPVDFRRTRIVILGALVLAAVVCLWVAKVEAQPAAVPPAVLTARSVFVVNETGFAELQYTAVLELSKWGRFELADSKQKADLVMVLSSGTHVRATPDGQFPRTTGLNAFKEEDVPKGHTKITLEDPKSGTALWSDVHRTEGGKVKSGHLLDELRQAYLEAEKERSKS